jgi:ribonuclease T2
MRMGPKITIGLCLLVVLAATAAEHHRPRRSGTEAGQPGNFDYYVLALSWSPEFCYNHAEKPECRGHYGFIVHGLWPQFADGNPENCSSQISEASLPDMSDIMPDPELIRHEWKTHGTCSGLEPAAYFKLIRQAFASVKVPSRFEHPMHFFSITPSDVKHEFLASNPRLQNEDMVVSCGNNYLTSVSICLTKSLEPTACQSLNDCRANVIRVPPVS